MINMIGGCGDDDESGSDGYNGIVIAHEGSGDDRLGV